MIERDYNNDFNAITRQIVGKVELLSSASAGAEYTGADSLKSVEIERTAAKGKFFGFGVSQKATIELLDKERAININKADALNIAFKLGANDYETVLPAAVEDVKRDENTNALTVVAHDVIYYASKFKVSDLTLTAPYTLGDFLNSCGELLGVSVIYAGADQYTADALSLFYEQGANFSGDETLRAALDAAAEVLLSVYYISNDNKLVFKRLDIDSAAVLDIDKSAYFTLKTQPISILSGITHATELGDNLNVNTGEDGATQYIKDNPFLNMRADLAEVLNTALATIGGLFIVPFNLEWRGNYLTEIGDKIAITTKNNEIAITYLLNDTIKYNGGFSQVTSWEFAEDEAADANSGNLGEVIKQTYAKVDKVNQRIELLASYTADNVDNIADLMLEAGSIRAEVARVEKAQAGELEDLNKELAEVKSSVSTVMTADKVRTEIKQELSNGVEKIDTTTGITLDTNGLTVDKTGSEMKTTISDNGMQVFKNGDEVLTADNTGVKAQNLHATTYLIVGNNSRFEDYIDSDGNESTGCFWIGG